jgi:hypothetical protein
VALGGDLLGELLTAGVTGVAGLLGQLVDRRPLLVDDVSQLAGDLVVDAPEVVVLESSSSISRMPFNRSPLASSKPDCIIRRNAAFRSPW